MKKKVNVFGKGIPVLAIFVLGLALVSAALVPYLSGMITGNVVVESPLVLTGGGFSVVAAEAFDPIERDFTLTNNANTDIYAVIDVRISTTDETELCNGENGCNIGDEFVSFMIGNQVPQEYCTNNNGEWIEPMCYWNVIGDMQIVGGAILLRYGDEIGYPVVTGTPINGKIKMQFKLSAAPDIYTFEAVAVEPSSTLGDAFVE